MVEHTALTFEAAHTSICIIKGNLPIFKIFAKFGIQWINPQSSKFLKIHLEMEWVDL